VKAALSFDKVVKAYGGGRRALDEMSFEIPTGVICGFIGPNGAGKTTSFSVVSGYLPPDAGTVDILGEGGFDPWRLKGRLGVLPQDAELPGRHKPAELLVHLARLQGMTAREAEVDAGRTLALVKLEERVSDPIDALSHGMRRRVAVATALLGAPELVLLDEPTAGLDPVQALSLRDALSDMRGRTTLVVSSHNLLELERLCDHVVMVDRGRCVRQGTVSDVTGQTARISATLGPGVVDLAALQAAIPGAIVSLTGLELSVAIQGGDPDAATLVLMAQLAASGIAIRELRRGLSLEQQFVADAAR
jgi:ABC-2 type transport system ATP-binding protein